MLLNRPKQNSFLMREIFIAAVFGEGAAMRPLGLAKIFPPFRPRGFRFADGMPRMGSAGPRVVRLRFCKECFSRAVGACADAEGVFE